MRVSISELLDRVKAQIGAKNDADLSRRLGHKQGVISQWRSGKKSPDDDAMADLYRLAGLDPTEALLRKRAALSKGPAREVYERLLRSVAALVLAAMIATATPVQAKNEQAFGSQGLYIMENIGYVFLSRYLDSQMNPPLNHEQRVDQASGTSNSMPS